MMGPLLEQNQQYLQHQSEVQQGGFQMLATMVQQLQQMMVHSGVDPQAAQSADPSAECYEMDAEDEGQTPDEERL